MTEGRHAPGAAPAAGRAPADQAAAPADVPGGPTRSHRGSPLPGERPLPAERPVAAERPAPEGRPGPADRPVPAERPAASGPSPDGPGRPAAKPVRSTAGRGTLADRTEAPPADGTRLPE